MTASKRFTTAFPSHSLRGFSRGFCLPDAGRPSFRDTALPQVKRVDDLLQRLTLDERIALLHHDAPPVERLGVASFRTGTEALHGVAGEQRLDLRPGRRNPKCRILRAARPVHLVDRALDHPTGRPVDLGPVPQFQEQEVRGQRLRAPQPVPLGEARSTFPKYASASGGSISHSGRPNQDRICSRARRRRGSCRPPAPPRPEPARTPPARRSRTAPAPRPWPAAGHRAGPVRQPAPTRAPHLHHDRRPVIHSENASGIPKLTSEREASPERGRNPWPRGWGPAGLSRTHGMSHIPARRGRRGGRRPGAYAAGGWRCCRAVSHSRGLTSRANPCGDVREAPARRRQQ